MANRQSDDKDNKATGAGTQPPFGAMFDFSKMLEQFKAPGVDMQALIEARKRDLEALTAANQRAYEGFKALAERQAEMLRESASEFQAAIKELSSLAPAERATRTAELGKLAMEKALANLRELAESGVKSQTEAWKIVNDQFKQDMADLQKAIKRG
ncbi:MAG: TIGR01841 family phasin [Burkholderiaceae bacterium]